MQRRFTGLRFGVAIASGVFAAICAHAQVAPDVFLDAIVANRFFTTNGPAPSIQGRLRSAAIVDVIVYDMHGMPIRAFEGPATASDRFVTTLSGLPPVEHGLYLFRLAARDEQDKRLGVFPASADRPELLRIGDSELNAEEKVVECMVPRNALIRLRAGLREGAFFETIVPWRPVAAGRQSFAWDGTCQGGLFRNLYEHPRIRVSAVAMSLPENALICTDAPPAATEPDAIRLPDHLHDLADAESVENRWEVLSKGRRAALVGDFRLDLGIEVDRAKRTMKIVVDCAPEDRPRLFNTRFEIMHFLDQTYVIEEEQAVLPQTTLLSTRGLAAGKHVLTVNIVNTAGELGTVSREFVVP